MNRIVLPVSIILLALVVGCGKSGGPLQTSQLSSGSNFAIISQEISGSADLAVNSQTADGMTILDVTANNAQDLRGVSFYLRLPDEAYRVERVEFSDFIGSENETLRFFAQPVKGFVPVAVLSLDRGSTGAKGNGAIAKLYLSRASSPPRTSSGLAPMGPENKAKDLTATPTGNPNEFMLTWKERHVGDYNNDGICDISDLASLAEHFLKTRSQFTNQEHFTILDGDGSNVLDIGDIPPLAQNFFTECAGFNIYIGSAASVYATVPRPTSVSPDAFVRYEYGPVVIEGSQQVWVAPIDRAGNAGVLSDAATVSSGGGAPSAPTGLRAESGQVIGVGKIYISWNRNSEPDISEYRLYRRIAGEASFGPPITTTPPLETSYTDSGLQANTTYEYAVSAVNTSDQESPLSEIASATPYFPPPLPAPTSLLAAGEGRPEGTIDITWVYSGPTDILANFELERKSPTDTDFVLIAEPNASARGYTDTGLTLGVLYTYRVRAVDFYGRKTDYSNESSSTPGEVTAVPPNITSLTTNRYTYGPEGGTGTLTCVADQPDVTYTWQTTAGRITGSGSTVTFTPPSGGAQKVTVTCTVTNAAGSDSKSIRLIVTTMQDHGLAPDFVDWSYRHQSSPYYNFSNYRDAGKVMTLNFMAWWCGPCEAEVPFFVYLMQTYQDQGYSHVAVHINYLRDWTWDDVTDWWATSHNGDQLIFTDMYHDTKGPSWDGTIFKLYLDTYADDFGLSGGIPTTFLLDRDGHVRFGLEGSLGSSNPQYEALVQELL